MFGQGLEIFRLFGFPVRVDASWIIIFLLITWTLAAGYFPARHPDFAVPVYWILGVFCALGLFVSIVIHEFAHALVGRRYGIPMSGITLFIFGGVSHMEDEPPSPGVEFLTAIAGPVTTLFIMLFFYGVTLLGQMAGWPEPVLAATFYLTVINLILLVFNLVPAFPLDGGRVLRSILWKWKKSLRWATKITSGIGSFFGVTLIVLGILNFIGGNFIGGLWWVLIGFFLRNAASASHQQLLVRQALEGEPVRRFMKREAVTVIPDLPLDRLVNDYFYQHYYKMYPVVENGRLLGRVRLNDVRRFPADQWPSRRVSEILDRNTEENTVAPDTPALEALARMSKKEDSRLLVVEDGHLAGILSLKDLMKFLSVRMELEEAGR